MKNTMRLLSGILVAGSLFVGACQDSQNSKKIAEDQNEEKFDTKAAEKDAQFVVDVAAANYTEIEYAQAALQKSGNQEIKDLATTLEADHRMFLSQLKAYASTHNISTPDSASADVQKSAMDMKEDKSAAEFDKKWCDELTDMHEKTIKKLEDASNEVSDPDLKTWIADALPKIRTHRDKLMECKNKLK